MILLILAILLFILVILRLMTIYNVYEGFVSDLDPQFLKEYDTFITFYDQFMLNWNNAIVSSIAVDTVQQPLTSPSQVSSTTPPQPSNDAINTYIQTLTQKLNIPLPSYTGPLPGAQQITSRDLPTILKLLPDDTTPFSNAIQWMNNNMSQAHGNLDTALQGGKISEGFYDSGCQDVAKCLENNPEFISQISQQITQSQTQSIADLQSQILDKIRPFNSNSDLQQSFSTNQDLFTKSRDIQQKAQNGELIKKINIPGADKKTIYTLPSGANNLAQMEKDDPDKYNSYKQNYGQWFGLKQMIDQINATL